MEGRVLLLLISCVVIGRGQSLRGPNHGKNVVCYLDYWSFHNVGSSIFHSNDLDTSLCTHVVYTFVQFDEKTNRIYYTGDVKSDKRLDLGYSFAGFKKRHPHLKVTLCVGGRNEESVKYSRMASDPKAREQFIQSVMTYLKEHDFDGLDIMWKYPEAGDDVQKDGDNFVTLIKELKEAFREQNYILNAALGIPNAAKRPVYDLVQLNQYLDMVYVLGYDYNEPWDGMVGANAPLNGTAPDDTRSVEYTIRYLIAFGLSREKMILGLPMFGRTFVLEDSKVNPVKFGATTAKETGFSGPMIKDVNYYGYCEVCLELTNNTVPWEYHWDEQTSTPYLRDKDRIISYDNPRSIANKVKIAIDYNLGGFMVWSMDTDDFKGLCAKCNDTYVDYAERFERISQDPDFKDALENFDLSNLGLAGDSYYIDKNNSLKFNTPEQNFSNYQLMRTINQATCVALDEIKILQAIWKMKGLEGLVRGEILTYAAVPTNLETCVDTPCVSSCIKFCEQPLFMMALLLILINNI